MSKVYVGTYRKYNEGSLAGDWLDLTDYSSKKDFIEACLELHDDEKDPELMFQDWEDIPADFIGESSIDEKVWEWLELSEDDRETVAMYREDVNFNAPIEEALECYQGEFDSEEDWAVDYLEQTGMLSEVPEQVQSYIDYEKFARDARLGGDMTFVRKGHRVRAFRRC